MARSYDIAIVGAGIGGLAAAIALGCADHRIVLYERFPQSRPIGSGLMLQPTGLAALERLGLRASVEALGARIERLHALNERGGLVFDLGYSELDPALYALGVHRAALHHALWSAFASGGAAIETGWTIVDVATGADGRAQLVDESARTSPAFDLVIDASGARSTLRRLASPAKARAFAYGAVWASVPDLGVAPAMLAQRYVAARIMIGHLPVGRTRADGDALAAFFWSLKPADHAAWRARFDDWREEVVRLWPALARLVEGFRGPDDFTFASYIHFTARRPFRGPLALIGDSAHATSPQLGQGANSALLDALAITDALGTAADIEGALHAYARLRRRHVRFYQFASAAMTPFFQSDSALLAGARDIAFHRLKIVPWLRGEMLRTLAGLKTGLVTSASAEVLAGMGRATKRNVADEAPSSAAQTRNS
jgi:2-polyprenyl-6-methoxyphenol hydroxylase-like FAD-dependent oxidoreductase